MKSFAIKKLKKRMHVLYLEGSLEGYHYAFKNDNLGIKELNILSEEIIDILIKYNFDKRYKKIIEEYLLLLNDEDSGEDGLLKVIDEVARLKSIMIKRYEKIIKREENENFLKKLKILENEVRRKIIDIRLIKEREMVYNISEEKVKSR